MLRQLKVSSCLLFLFAIGSSAQDSRHFTFKFAFSVKNLPAGEKVQIWIPAAKSDAFQEVNVVSTSGDAPLRRTTESKYGNVAFYAETSSANRELHFGIVYDVIRHERIALGIDAPPLAKKRLSPEEKKKFLQADALVPISGEPAKLAAKVTEGSTTPLDKARAIYDYVFATLRYDKTGDGWGRGDALYACDAKKGNCTDFHSLFIAMARSQGIPARFEIGFPLPPEKQLGEIAGYHCWSDFYVDGKGWIPVDISEAWKHPEKKDYFFGSHDVNRIQFSQGRDLRLSPPQSGRPLNYFVYPYVEVDGKEYSNVSLDFSFSDVK